MRNLVFLFVLLLSSISYPQNLDIKVINSGLESLQNDFLNKIKYDVNGNPVILTFGYDYTFYFIKSSNGNFKSPKPITNSRLVDRWDFDIDVNGTIHLAFSEKSNDTLKFFYSNSNSNVKHLIFDTVAFNLNQYSVRVLRTPDNQLIVNFVFALRSPQDWRDYLFHWLQLTNPGSNSLNLSIKKIPIRATIAGYPNDLYLYHHSNKNLFIQLGQLAADNYGSLDTFVVSETLLKVNQLGELYILRANTGLSVDTGQAFTSIPFPFFIADNNESVINWLNGELVAGGLFRPDIGLKFIILDNSNNVHILKKELVPSTNNYNLFYEIYTPENLPINSSHSVYLRRIFINPSKVTYRTEKPQYLESTYGGLKIVIGALNANKSILLIPELYLNFGSTLFYHENGNLSKYYLITSANSRNKLGDESKFLYRDNSLWIFQKSHYDSLDANTGRIYLFKLKNSGDDLISNLREDEILKIDFPQISPQLNP